MKARCNKCDSIFSAEPDAYNVIVCPNCNAKMRVRPKPDEAAGSGSPPPEETKETRVASKGSTSRTPASAPTPSGPRLPAAMRANKVIAGKECPACKAPIDLGVQVHNCEKCGASHHEQCWDQHGGCAAEACQGGLQLREEPEKERASDDGGETQPCKFCGEAIKVGARKCRFCGEYQSERDRQAQVQRTSNSADDNLSSGEWVVAIICAGIGCIVGIIWCIQGKKKGPKMVLVSFLAWIFWMIVQVALSAAGGR